MKSSELTAARLPIILLAAMLVFLFFSVGFFVMRSPSASTPTEPTLAARVDDLQQQLAALKSKVDRLSAEDIILADFEGPDYGSWTATGTAFATEPAHGTLLKQNPVTGFQGHGLVNTYLG